MLLPLCLIRKRGIVTVEFPDLDVSDYNAPILAPDFLPTKDEFAALWGSILQALPRADMIKFEKIPETVAN